MGQASRPRARLAHVADVVHAVGQDSAGERDSQCRGSAEKGTQSAGGKRTRERVHGAGASREKRCMKQGGMQGKGSMERAWGLNTQCRGSTGGDAE